MILIPQVGDYFEMSYHLISFCVTGGQDFVSVNGTFQMNDSSIQEVFIEVVDDSMFEETTKRFMAIGSLEGATFDGRVRLQPNFVMISIEGMIIQ